LDLILSNNDLKLFLEHQHVLLVFLFVDFDLDLLGAIPLIILSQLQYTSSMPQILLEPAFIVMLAIGAAARLAASAIRNQHALAVSHVMPPVTNVSLFSIAVKVLSLTIPLVVGPISNVVLFVIIIALPMAPVSQIGFPIACEFVTRLFFLIGADIGAPPISLIQIVNVSFIYVSVCIVDFNYFLF
jgi:hypothetical protein